jgi:N-acetylglucosamine-6-sulfatase
MEKKPNLLFVFADEWRRQALGCMNEDPAITPNLDRFAAEGTLFTNAVATCPLCVPARATIFTGRYPQSTGVVANRFALPESEESFAKPLNAAGYSTGYIGKWHLDGRNGGRYDTPEGEFIPEERRHGFRFWYGANITHNHYLINHFTGKDTHVYEYGWQPDRQTDVAIDFIKRNKENPFALFVSWTPPHPATKHAPDLTKVSDKGQYFAPEEFEKLYEGVTTTGRPNFVATERAVGAIPGYYGSITSLDENFGRLMQTLEEEGLTEDTIVVFTADHGDMMGSHADMGKHIWYEESIGIPFLIRWPSQIKAGRDSAVFSQLDFMPTLLGLMGVNIPAPVQGTDFSPRLLGRTADTPDVAYIFQDGVKPWWRCVRTERYSYAVHQGRNDKIERILYDLANDPYQIHPIGKGQGHDDTIAVLEGKMAAWLESENDPFLQEVLWTGEEIGR